MLSNRFHNKEDQQQQEGYEIQGDILKGLQHVETSTCKSKHMSCNNICTSPTVQQIFLKDPNVSVQGIWSKRISRVTPIPFPHLIAVRTKWHVWVCWRWRFLGTNPCGRQGRLPGVHLCLETGRSLAPQSPSWEDPLQRRGLIHLS